MDRIVYDRMAEHDSTHWWYVARRDILADFIGREVNPPKGARILEIGCGTGHNLPMLGAFGEVDAIEIDPAAREIASKRLGKEVGSAPLPELSGVAEGQYDMIAVLDVVEHIEDDVAALEAMAKRLKPGGTILITVPAHQWMWSAHDVVNHHKRRYSKATLIAALERAGLKWRKLGYFNSLLFPAAVAARLAGKLTGKDDSDDSPPAKPLNAIFEKIFGLERHLVGRVPLPPGLSLIVLAQPNG
ncbi:class I SAM-dependent methyltransferase [Sphingomonas koreensis]|jgi:SAM-dependent methyltransferase|uniref:SAM-dependent methyltransferase n=1 Tax=Sphingomonas koreensis TaxID=93064 RepID=A0A1L6J9D5_9SPHN|nr:class I SAM-dependent methyltransferase [Sphingomonas koreensis]APR52494.1 SAM-dependent methyltransferase [Sphingomonas koreensis]MDC7811668.1 class I SAM-dependent methyltransferase [Sphingomonas koreensis]RSU17981.1 class I SAM-dependent methyltransferase [Sphingomonas koreensis]RSU22148.1 class I SAM-dependent methyltransferase [Sphingomonas koreensis]RSU23800.1 class I SAM-dependent methyltransferase [Sphingomonas koreensis]